MRTIRKKISNVKLSYPLEKLYDYEDCLFIDIETTGFTAKSSILYLIGCVYYEKNEWNSIQWFATAYEDEKLVITAFFEFAQKYKCLIHFNGNNFDLPFILQKCNQYSLPYNFDAFDGIDIYKRISPFKVFLGLPNCKQKTIEQFLGIDREDPFDGGELISIYHDFVKNQTDFAYNAILCHNADDIAGMLQLLPILAYADIFSEQTKVKKVQANYFQDINKENRQELFIKLQFPTPLPKLISYRYNGCYFTGEGQIGTIKVPLYEEEMKYFYSNYKDYYYLPLEDIAVHKSIASFVDKERREQAKASTCYTRKVSTYLPQWSIEFEPFFKRDYASKDLFFEVTDEFKTNRKAFQKYAVHVLQMMGK